MSFSRLNIATLVLIAGSFALAAWYYPALPDPVPTHWNAQGQVDGWTAKPWGVWLLPLITLGTTLLLLILPTISPKGFRLDAARRAYDIIIFIVAGFMAVVQLLAWRSALYGAESLMRYLPAMLGLLFILLGNYMGKFPKNFFVGIRTPWTLASDQVWNATHRLGGYLFMAAGALIALSSAFISGPQVVIGATVIAALVPAVYSLWLYKRLHGFGGEPPATE